jgi:hypothetical protein
VAGALVEVLACLADRDARPARGGADAGDRRVHGVLPEVVGLPVGDLLQQVRFGPAVDGRRGQDGVLQLGVLPAAEGALGQEPLAQSLKGQRLGPAGPAPVQRVRGQVKVVNQSKARWSSRMSSATASLLPQSNHVPYGRTRTRRGPRWRCDRRNQRKSRRSAPPWGFKAASRVAVQIWAFCAPVNRGPGSSAGTALARPARLSLYAAAAPDGCARGEQSVEPVSQAPAGRRPAANTAAGRARSPMSATGSPSTTSKSAS